VELEAHLRWNAVLCLRSGIAFSLEGVNDTSELGEGQGAASLRGNTLPPDFFLLDVLEEIQYLSRSCWVSPAKKTVPGMVFV
jgi:hypothetical protein